MPVFAKGQEFDINKQKLNKFAHAVARTEGFGTKNTIPTRYHNPGDLKCKPKDNRHFKGMKGVGKGGHTIFKNDEAGWEALRTQITLVLEGHSKNFNRNMTINQMAKKYAKDWHRWANNMSHNLGVSPDTTLADYFEIPPDYGKPDFSDILASLVSTPVTPIPVFASGI